MFTDNFDRGEMLTHWSSNIIIPAFETYLQTLENLNAAKDNFLTTPAEDSYNELTSAWLTAYKAWQHVSMFDIGRAESLGLRNYTNIYPSDTVLIKNNIASMDYNLELPSNFDAQGFPALDYMLFGTGSENIDRIALLQTDNYITYLDDLIQRLVSITREVVEDWKNGFQTSFNENNGSSATASVDKLVNDFLFYYEKYLRAGKIGIPAGIFSGNPMSGTVEAPYSGIYSKELFFEGFMAVQNFFKGISHDQATNGISLEDYLDHISMTNQTADLASSILEQWTKADQKASLLSADFKAQVETDNTKMLETYDELQKSGSADES